MTFSALTRSLLVGSALIAVAYTAGAQARQPTVFMLQFGSFETKDEANDKLKAIGTKHGGILTKYPPLIREITMPPDNLTVYRTQAGPVNTRETAQSVCAQLASQGDECYVVETAMNIPGTAPAIQQAGIIPKDEKSDIIPTNERPLPTRDPENLKTLAQVSKPLPQVKQVPEAKKAEMIQAMDDAAAAPAAMSAPAPRISSDQKLTGATKPPLAEAEEKQGSFWSWLDGDDEADTDSDEWAKVKAEADRKAMAEAAANRAAPVDTVATQDMTPPAPLAPPAPQVVVPVAPVAPDIAIMTPEPLKTLAENTTVQSSPTMPPPAPFRMAQAAPAPMQAAPIEAPAPTPNAFTPPAPVMAPQTMPTVQTVAEPLPVADAQLGSGGLRLPPPPPPTNSDTRAAFERGDVPPAPIISTPAVPFAQSGPAPVIAPVTPESTGSITATNLAPVPFKQGASVKNGTGEAAKVEVGEAQRVPLTETQQQAPIEQLPAKVIGVNEAAETEKTEPVQTATAIAPPSSSAIQKTLWAHVHYFPDQQVALGFWDHYRKTHPDFPVVRVRTTSSLVAQQQGDMRVALRIGPFAQQGFIGILCNSIKEVDENLTCGAIADMGASANAYAPRDRFAQGVAASARYANKIAPKASGYWVQLGTYASASAAELAWDDARTQHSDALSDMEPAIVSPEQGSQSGAVFRLRTGPFSTQMAAKEVCSRVKVNSGTCLVVSE